MMLESAPATPTDATRNALERSRADASLGDTGGARVGAFATMPIVADLRAIIDSATDR